MRKSDLRSSNHHQPILNPRFRRKRVIPAPVHYLDQRTHFVEGAAPICVHELARQARAATPISPEVRKLPSSRAYVLVRNEDKSYRFA